MKRITTTARAVLALPAAVLFTIFLIVPLLVLLRYSFATSERLQISLVWTLGNYKQFFKERMYLEILLTSLGVASLVSVLEVLIGFPAAWVIARAPEARRNFLLILLIVPWWASYVVRAFAWYTLFGNNGLINRTLISWGLAERPLAVFTFSMPAVIATELNLFLPLMVMPIYMTLEKLDWNLVLAARGLGARPWYAFFKIVLPLSLPGVVAGVILVFMPVAGSFVVPDLVGGTRGLMFGKVIATQFGTASNWAFGSALAVMLLVVLLLALNLLTRLRERISGEFY